MTRLVSILFFVCFIFAAGCARQTLYVDKLDPNKEITPQIYFVTYDDGFLYALHSVELQPGWKLNFYDKSAGVIEALTDQKDTFTVRISSLDQGSTKIFAFMDAAGFSLDSEARFTQSLTRYYEQLNAHIR